MVLEQEHGLTQTKQKIADSLVLARNKFIKENNSQKVEDGNLAYRPEFDRQEYVTLSKFKESDPFEYEKAREELDTRTRRQLETLLGERFNVKLSTTRYEIKDGKIFGENSDEPFIDVLKRGRDYRKLYGNPVDHDRENAEFDGFSKIQDVLCVKDAQLDTVIVSVSPPGEKGSDYQHNFYDVFALRADEKGKYIEARRYSSALSNSEYVQKLKELKPDLEISEDANDAYFLANPVKIEANSQSVLEDRIHQHFHKEHEYMSEEDFRSVIGGCSGFIAEYTKTLAMDPRDERTQVLILNAILNRADYILDRMREDKEITVGRIRSSEGYSVRIDSSMYKAYVPTREELYMLGTQPVRQVNTGCGGSGGFSLESSLKSNNSYVISSNAQVSSGPFSVGDFGISSERTLKCNCPSCGESVNAKISNGKITCPECHVTADYKC